MEKIYKRSELEPMPESALKRRRIVAWSVTALLILMMIVGILAGAWDLVRPDRGNELQSLYRRGIAGLVIVLSYAGILMWQRRWRDWRLWTMLLLGILLVPFVIVLWVHRAEL